MNIVGDEMGDEFGEAEDIDESSLEPKKVIQSQRHLIKTKTERTAAASALITTADKKSIVATKQAPTSVIAKTSTGMNSISNDELRE